MGTVNGSYPIPVWKSEEGKWKRKKRGKKEEEREEGRKGKWEGEKKRY